MYIDLPADLWPTLSPKIGQVLLPNVRNVFFGARGIRTVEEDEDGAGVGWAMQEMLKMPNNTLLLYSLDATAPK